MEKAENVLDDSVKIVDDKDSYKLPVVFGSAK